MSSFNVDSAVAFAEKNPVIVGLGVFVVGLGALYLMGFFGKGSGDGGGQANLASEYFAAQSASTASGNALQAAQIQAEAATKIAMSSDAKEVSINTLWAQNGLDTAKENNATALALAPYSVQSQALASYTALAANAQPVTTTTTKKSSGFLGIGGGSKTTTTTAPNPFASSALEEINYIVTHPGGYAASH